MADITIMNAGDCETLFLATREALTVIAAAIGSANVTRLGDKAGEAAQGTVAITDGQTKTIDPFSMPSRHEIACMTGSVSVIGNTIEMIGAGAPSDGVTGVNIAGIGSRYTDTTLGKLYINGGTLADPIWKIVTSA